MVWVGESSAATTAELADAVSSAASASVSGSLGSSEYEAKIPPEADEEGEPTDDVGLEVAGEGDSGAAEPVEVGAGVCAGGDDGSAEGGAGTSSDGSSAVGVGSG